MISHLDPSMFRGSSARSKEKILQFHSRDLFDSRFPNWVSPNVGILGMAVLRVEIVIQVRSYL